MKKIFISIMLIICLSLNTLADTYVSSKINSTDSSQRLHSARKAIDSLVKIEGKEVSIVDDFKNMFTDAKLSGQVKTIYAGYNYTNQNDIYATAIGGILKYELASLNGFNAGVAVYTSQDLPFATGAGAKQNSELSSSLGSYTEMAEAYINYKYEEFNFRAGRQVLETPLADSDDIRLISNTFEAYVGTYSFDALEIMAGSIMSWQGFDTGLETPWVKTGDKGTYFAGVNYNNGIEFKLWYYNITGLCNALYFDIGLQYPIKEDIILHTLVQYLNESELNQSTTEATIYGGLFELIVHGIGFNIAYDKALVNKNKKSFSGVGGGALFTNMDTMILDNIANNSDAEAIVGGLVYKVSDFGFLYAYGDFVSETAHVTEQDLSIEYSVNDEFIVAGIFVIQEDLKNKTKTNYDWNRLQLIVNYNF